jgi:hypothetical protein
VAFKFGGANTLVLFVVCIVVCIKLFALLIFIFIFFCFKFLYPAVERTSNMLDRKHEFTSELTHVCSSAKAHFTHTVTM